MQKVLLAMSGGIDSSVSAMLLKDQNFFIEGITFRSYDAISKACMEKETGCCSVNSIFEAKHLAETLGFEHTIIDTRQLFEQTIIKNFINQYLRGFTPNPCVLCNKIIKWGALFNFLKEKNIDFLATGHYARISSENGRFFLQRGVDYTKDQSYFLWDLSQENLQRTIFPLGELTKLQVREIAKNHNFTQIATKKESQEICFIETDNYRDFLREKVPNIDKKIGEGNFINKDGKILGKHKGFPFYTIGQRKGLIIALGKPAYVININHDTNTIILGEREDLMSSELWIKNVNFMKYENLHTPIKALCRIRYKSPAEMATIQQFEDKLKIVFDKPIFAITPGQSAVIYENDDVVAGGIICK
ncbi:MAG: tRNA 2-thiouridine(34) synthase MnmA [Bacteroidales bacterium]|jgi:tRNA-specific 2-thiouridylase|nr:tRNA 2-thiouridine(34) synthase MnmA [Bacteroidales bacterium]